MIKIIDDYLDRDKWNKCLDYFRGGNWCFPPIDGPTGYTSVWRIFNPLIEESVGEVLYGGLKEFEIDPLAIKRVGINGATALNESHLHVDGPIGDMSMVWFGSKVWDQDWGGSLRICGDNGNVVVVKYIPNRAVLFPSHLSHIPDPPRVKNRLRVSVGLHLTPSSEWNYKYIPRNNNGVI